MSPNPLFIRPWPLWKRMLQKLWEAFEWGDDEYLRFTIGHYPYTVWVTVYEPDCRRSWHRRVFPWRLRFAWASLLKQYVCSMCTICNSRFSLRELLSRDDSLIRFQSGSICHRDCPARVRGRWIDRRLAENVLYAFSVEPKHDRQTLENYLLRYPELADELIDLSHELRLVAELGVLNEHDGNHDSN